jgi:hypothetical protein
MLLENDPGMPCHRNLERAGPSSQREVNFYELVSKKGVKMAGPDSETGLLTLSVLLSSQPSARRPVSGL